MNKNCFSVDSAAFLNRINAGECLTLPLLMLTCVMAHIPVKKGEDEEAENPQKEENTPYKIDSHYSVRSFKSVVFFSFILLCGMFRCG